MLTLQKQGQKMRKNDDGSVTFTVNEIQALSRFIDAASVAITDRTDDIDFLPDVKDFRAMCMLEDYLHDIADDLTDYVEGHEKGRAKTVQEWLENYGKGYYAKWEREHKVLRDARTMR
jgi:hypothetical protein